ncbi:NfrA family protein [Halomonas sp. V046]|uniref:NfrA family protein n=1 Tax=Halomonas sp. V046 TaxID=3459611 RepID=UPI0040450ACF
MTPAIRAALLTAVALWVAPPVTLGDDALSELQRFRSYPYLDKAYHAVEDEDWREVQRLMEYLIQRVPENAEARRLLAQALQAQGQLGAAIDVLSGLADEGAEAQVQELRLAQIRAGEASADTLSRWLGQTRGQTRERLWKTEAQRLNDRHGPRAALDWLLGLSSRDDDAALHRYRAVIAEQAEDWTTILVELSPTLLPDPLAHDDWRRLTTALIQTNDIHGFSRLLEQLPDPQRRYALKAGAESAIELGFPGVAKRWLTRLETLGPLDEDTRQQLLQTSLATGDVASVRRLADQGALDCLSLSAWLSEHHDPDALTVLGGCDPAQDPQTWLILAARLEATELLAETTLPEPWHDRQQQVLLDAFTADGRLADALAVLAQLPQDAATLSTRAELERRLGKPLAAADSWTRHYRLTGQAPSLEQASYLLVDAGRPGEARRLLEDELARAPQAPMPQTLSRLAMLYAEQPQTLSASILDTLIGRLTPVDRDRLLETLATTGRCDLIPAIAQRQDVAPPWRALGLCSPQRPGQAVVAFRQALAESLARGDGDRLRQDRKALAYALFDAGDAQGAWQEWLALSRDLPADASLGDDEIQAAARSALAAGDADNAWRLWAPATPASTPDSLLLGARIAQARGDDRKAMALAERATVRADNAATLASASAIAERAGEARRSLAWLNRAHRLSGEAPGLTRQLGLRLASGEGNDQRRAIGLLERSRAAFPEDVIGAATLGSLYYDIGDNARSLSRSRRAIDLQPIDLAVGDADSTEMAQRRYRLRRQHQTLTQRDRVTLASAWGPTSPVPGVTSDDVDSAINRDGINTQVLEWDHALGQDPIHQGRQLAAYTRLILGDSERYDYGAGRSVGLGLRAKPFGDINLNLYAEAFAENQKNDDRHTRYDLLLRASGSFLDQGEFRNDWRPTETDWSERSLYLSGAWWTHSGDVQLMGRLQRGHTFKLPTDTAQTLMPYTALQASSHDTSTWDEDTRVAAGLRWQLWFDQDRYNAYRRKASVGVEYQQSLGGNLYDDRDGWQVNLEVTL